MSLSESFPPLHNADFDAIEATLLASEAGRRFLADYVERNRSKETTLLLENLRKLESVVHNRPSPGDVEALRREIAALGEAIALTRRGIAEQEPARLGGAVDPGLDSIAVATQRATDHIISAAEIIGQISGALREQGMDQAQIANLDKLATELRGTCAGHGASDRRIEKVMKILDILESRIAWLAQSKYLASASGGVATDLPDAGIQTEPKAEPLSVT